MRIQGSNPLYAAYQSQKDSVGSLRDRKKALERSSADDRVEISAEGMSRLQKVRERLDSGFYDQESVQNDISEKISNVLDKMIQ